MELEFLEAKITDISDKKIKSGEKYQKIRNYQKFLETILTEKSFIGNDKLFKGNFKIDDDYILTDKDDYIISLYELSQNTSIYEYLKSLWDDDYGRSNLEINKKTVIKYSL